MARAFGPDLDFTPLSQLGQVFEQAQQKQQRRDALSTLGTGNYADAIGKLAAVGDLEGASRVAAIQKSLAPESSADLQAYRLYRQQGGAAPFLAFKKELAQAGATRINNNVTATGGGGSDKQIFEELGESAKSARAAATGLSGLGEARKALQGGMISGFGADQQLAFRKLGAFMGLGDVSKIENTETFRSAIAPQIAAMMKATVGSTQISNADREFAEKAAGGSIALDERSISRLLDIMERGSREVVMMHNQRLDDIYPDGTEKKFRRERALFGVRMPNMPAVNQPASGGNRTRSGVQWSVE